MTSVLETFGYTETEGRFLELVMSTGGYFVRRQFNQFAACQNGKRTQDFVHKLFSRGHARLTVNRYARQVMHVHFKPFYLAIDADETRNRRAHQPRAIKARLMILDFALAHPDSVIIASETGKSAYLRERHGIESGRLDRIVLAISEHQSPPLAFCYIDEGLLTLSGFETSLRRALPMFRAVSHFHLIYVAAHLLLFNKVEAAFQRIVLGIRGGDTTLDAGRLLRHFVDRHLFESRQTQSFDKRRLDQLREDRDEFSASLHEALYHLWCESGDDAVRSRLRSPQPASPRIEAIVRTHLLEHDYEIFDTLRVAS